MARPKPRPPMKKTSITMPDELIASLTTDAKKSGFKHWSEQARYELMKPRGMWTEIKPYLPTQVAPSKA